MQPLTIRHGVDFSGARDAARKICIATAPPDEPVSIRRGVGHDGLVELIAASADDGLRQTWRIDAPFSVPRALLDRHGIAPTWMAMADWLASFKSAPAWRDACRARQPREERRACDHAAGTPMAPVNLRVYRQTWSVIVRVLRPLAARGISIEPVARTGSAVVVAEGCPASVLEIRGWPRSGYKGRDPAHRRRRLDLLRRVEAEGLRVPTSLRRDAAADAEADILDALLLCTDPAQTVAPAEAAVEAWVY